MRVSPQILFQLHERLHASCLYRNDLSYLRPVTLTSAVMEVCERVVLCKLEKLLKDYIDPLQFAYRKYRSTDDAVLYSLENIYSHLEKTGL